MKPQQLCADCIAVRDLSYRAGAHLVHPRTHEPNLFDVFGCGLCLACYTLWCRTTKHTYELVATS